MSQSHQYCPHVSTCPFHKNLMEYGSKVDKRDDVIIRENSHYKCLALIAIDHVEGGIPMGRELQSRLSEPNKNEQECSHLTLLNLLEILRRFK